MWKAEKILDRLNVPYRGIDDIELATLYFHMRQYHAISGNFDIAKEYNDKTFDRVRFTKIDTTI